MPDVTDVVTRVAERMLLRWMRRRKIFDERPHEERANEAPSQSPLEACMQLSLFGGTFLKLDKSGVPPVDEEDDERLRPRTKSPLRAEVRGFNLHAGVTVRAGEREALERLCRYGARPCFSTERLSVYDAGRWPRGVSTSQAAHSLCDPPGDDAGAILGANCRFGAPTAIPMTAFAGVLA
jgi:hypothetical protein